MSLLDVAPNDGVSVIDEEEGGQVDASPSSVSARRPLGLGVALLGITLVFSACLCGPLFLIGSLAEGLDEMLAQQIVGPFVLAVGFGGVLVWEGRRMWYGAPSARFAPRTTWPLWGAFGVLLVVGGLFFYVDQSPAFLLVAINTLTLGLLPLLMLGMVGRFVRHSDTTWRDVLGGLLGGATIGTGVSIVAEVSLAVLVALAAVGLGLLPGGLEGLQSMIEQMQSTSLLLDPQAFAELLTPGIVFVALAFIAIATPLVEEATKTLGIGVAGLWLRPSAARAFVLGVASGAGFALVENLLNGAMISSLWAPSVFSRLAATLMHCATGGLMGWGWGELWARRRPWRWLLAFMGAVGVHGLWNGMVGGIVATGLMGDMDNPVSMAVGGLVMLALASGLGLLILATLMGLFGGSWVLGRLDENGPNEG
ncbi:MAG: PrsW family intramembrane metalloprotease [Anaerolineae bacterium]|nr:PrsW family intramembrane metalloprotease [Anaerolineae bacterium]